VIQPLANPIAADYSRAMPIASHRVGLLTDIFLGMAYADGHMPDRERSYVCEVVLDLLNTYDLPPEVEQRIDRFDPAKFDLESAAADFLREPPMSARRLLELAAYVSLADGEMSEREEKYIDRLGVALRLPPAAFSDLRRERVNKRSSFSDLARVRLPG
jgi:tellurite resistance protein